MYHCDTLGHSTVSLMWLHWQCHLVVPTVNSLWQGFLGCCNTNLEKSAWRCGLCRFAVILLLILEMFLYQQSFFRIIFWLVCTFLMLWRFSALRDNILFAIMGTVKAADYIRFGSEWSPWPDSVCASVIYRSRWILISGLSGKSESVILGSERWQHRFAS